MNHELRPVATAEDRAAMHAIRRAALFTPERGVIYDEQHPHDLNPANQCFLLFYGAHPIGVVRLDPWSGDAMVVRLVGILPERQGQGHGRALGLLVEEEARRRGARRLMLNSRDSAVGFYEKSGWSKQVWDADELTGGGAHCVQMVKAI
jgi:GNAT superfamily N-acetyltransferase